MLTGQGFCAVVSAASLGSWSTGRGPSGRLTVPCPASVAVLGPKPAEAKDAAVGDWPVFE
ncbi:hypothetical protein MCC01968_06400 [Bifidobacteriaceae bacterium MCC01968]|nr:hypothetical protein MCC01951_13160 [Bifidobacteriaceae bacterium MCC01951]GDZ32918.1 hypothetical protein MCC01961_15860 [Bifidobacteriaceae bacterium MCC01961]GDZ37921.1 hypothetical protein MCC01964_05470 [Bifidobacteriaceae bacterium MCC01964]GDZ42083.1 hypothetical protein MCC01966_06490 [Bifidobacteriaceae bacterium MCC01966]GDZ69098.1 hypothetical protein MCC02039_01420 [Bifidobacteriaceae bacterium MCC02039]GDZ79482.1 hypothetical protein MCC01969_05890 [Bifidobacteriaceae bacterium